MGRKAFQRILVSAAMGFIRNRSGGSYNVELEWLVMDTLGVKPILV